MDQKIGMIGVGIGTSIIMISNESQRSSSHISASHEIQHAGNWISRDVKMAQYIDTSDDIKSR